MNTDPRTTAYTLGELSGSDRERFEAEMAASSDLRGETGLLSRLADRLAAAPKPVERFTSAERAALIAKCAAQQKARNTARHSLKVLFWSSLGVAAGFVAFAGLLYLGPQSGPTFLAQKSSSASRQYLPGPASGPAKLRLPAPDDPQLLALRSAQSANVPHMQAATPSAALAALKGQGQTTNQGANIPPMQAALKGQRPTANIVAPASELASLACLVTELEKPLPAPSNFNTEAYAAVRENEFVSAGENPLSTFSIDVDTASYSNVRRFLEQEQLPPSGAIRTEELVNYFRYDYPQPQDGDPFSVNLEISRAPWNAERQLVRIGLKGRELPDEERGAANLVFLIDTSGSMIEPDKLPLLQRSLSVLVENLSEEDRVSIVTYAGSSGLVLPPTSGGKKREILEAIANLGAGGSTHGSEGIRLAYETARENFARGGNNRVILCTDGDFNVGVTNESELQKLIEQERESDVFLSVLGFGTGNLKDSTMEMLADKGNGNYAYIDTIGEGRKVLVEQMGATLFTIAKDVKIQVEFNPARVAGYRLIGYENRLLAKEDFNDDKKDAGEIGAGHTVTALYEIIPAGQKVPGAPSVDPLKYQRPDQASEAASDELLTVKLRYKAPEGDTSRLMEVPLRADDVPDFARASEDFRFASAVAAFGMKLRGSPEAGHISWEEIREIARSSMGRDPGSYRAEFLTLIEKAKASGQPDHSR